MAFSLFYTHYTLIALVALTPIGLIWLYFRMLPRPIPNIPHRGTHRNLLGDIPDLVEYRKVHRQNISWLTEQCVKLNAPLVQTFVTPFSKPLLVLNDYREGEDIATRRAHEFDISPTTINLFEGLVPNATISLYTHDRFKAQRRLWAGTMSTEFLNRVPALEVLKAAQMLVRLWQLKAKSAQDKPFSATNDLRYAALDAIWAAAMGSDLGSLPSTLDAMTSAENQRPEVDSKGAAKFQEPSRPPLCVAVDNLIDSTAALQSNPFPKLTIFYQRFVPRLRAARNLKNHTMAQMLREGRAKYTDLEALQQFPTCAMEQVLQREAATKEKNAPQSDSPDQAIIDELFVWLVAGHETTVTTLSWGYKYLSENLDIQRTLRAAIIAATGTAHITDPNQILGADIPYLDAVVWEMLRIGRPAGAIMRMTVVDTEILGYAVPKGSNILISTSGFSYLDEKDIPVNEARRSRSSQASKRSPRWDFATLRQFDPQRWLKEVDGKVEFDLNAGPAMPFGAGPRGCFGRRLAMIELKLFVSTLTLAFDFQPLPSHLNTYDGVERVTRQPRECYVRLRSV